MLAQFLLLMMVPALLAAAAIWDLASFTIPNYLSLALIALFGAFALATGLSATAAGLHVLIGLIALAIGFAMFALNYIGGGDAKLFAGRDNIGRRPDVNIAGDPPVAVACRPRATGLDPQTS